MSATLLTSALYVIHHSTIGPKEGGEYSEALIGQPKYINPLFANANDIDSDLVTLIYAGLFTTTEHGLVPELAENVTVSPDGKTYTIKLKQNIYWSDGEPFSADDVTFTLESAQNPEVGSTLLPAFQGVRVEKIDDTVVRCTLKEPFAPFLHSLTVGILPSHIWSEIPPSNLKLATINLQPVGTGPWMFSKLTKDSNGTIQTYSLNQNPLYFGKKPFLKNLTFKFFTDYSTAIEALKSQNVSAISFVPHELSGKLPIKSIDLHTLEFPQYTALFFNQGRQPLLKNDRMRQALMLGLDKENIVEKGLEGAGNVIDSAFFGAEGKKVSPVAITFDKPKALSLLDAEWTRVEPEEYFKIRSEELLKSSVVTSSQNNITSSTPAQEELLKKIATTVRQEMNPDQPFYRHDKNNNFLSLTITTADTPEYRRVGELITNMWRLLGIRASLQLIAPRQIAREIIKPRAYDILLYGEIIGSDPDPFPFWHSSQVEYPGLNLSLYTNRTADKLLEDGRTTLDETKRMGLYTKFQDIIRNDLPAIFLYSPLHTFAVNKNIKGINLHQLAAPPDRLKNASSWYMKTSLIWKK